MKILILLVYYNRPKMVRYALESVRRAARYHPDFELACIDDGSEVPLQPIAEKMLPHLQHNITYTYVGYGRGTSDRYSNHGQYMNQAIKDSSAEVALVLCDDDALVDDYLVKLSAYYTDHPEAMITYSWLQPYDPFTQTPWVGSGPLIEKCGAGSMAWRTALHARYNIWFDTSRLLGLDARFMRKLQDVGREPIFLPCVGQYKGVHRRQLKLRVSKNRSNDIDLP